MAAIPKAAKPRTKAAMNKVISEITGLPASQVNDVLETLREVVLDDLSPDGVGSVTVAGLIKIDVVATKATEKRMGRNPATGEPIEIPAKMANDRGKLRTRALKPLREVL